MSDNPGVKFDDGKPRTDLLDATWLLGIAGVMRHGANKYGPHNWRGGIALSRLIAATLRHLFAFMHGEDFDAETGMSHLLHASCCLMMLYVTWVQRKDLDDRV